jgi:hypothetical protein
MANCVSLTTTAVVSLLILAAGLSPAMALKCQTSAGTCYDTKTKEYRKCTTKVCTDDKGTVVSTETVLEMQGGGAGGWPWAKSHSA